MILLFNKPFNVLSQFTDNSLDASKRQTLSDFIDIPKVYPAGRLDRDSEGLLILTDNGRLQARISNPKHKTPKTYWAQVEGAPSDRDLDPLRRGITLKDGKCLPAKVELMSSPDLWERDPPVRYRKSVPDTWISLTITEGRNRQVRRMTAAIGFPTLRLVRAAIGDWTIQGIDHGTYKVIG